MKDIRSQVNVKIPELCVNIIDKNLEDGKSLQKAGFRGRAHFVQEVVIEKLIQLGLLSQENQKKLEAVRKARRSRRPRRS
jgi:hypothetical protein